MGTCRLTFWINDNNEAVLFIVESKYHEIMIQPSEILQMDATMIVGIFILLTIKSFKFSDHQPRFSYFTKEQLVAAIILPFSASAIQILIEYASNKDLVLGGMELIMPIVGFIYVIIMIFVIAKYTKVEI